MAILDWRELQALNNEKYEKGVGERGDVDAGELSFNDEPVTAPAEDEDKKKVDRRPYADPFVLPERLSYDKEEVLDSGYGSSKRDLDVPYSIWRENPIDARANAQSAAEKIVNGALKSAVVTGTTLADNTAGLILGVAGMGKNLVEHVANDGELAPLTSFRDNLGFANLMQTVRDKSEEWFPNYRSTEELADADEWWKHLNANFWGDTFLKNFGFTVGAGLSFGLFGKIPRVLQAKHVGRAYKTAVAAAAGDGDAEIAIRNVLQGASMKNPAALVEGIDKGQKIFNRIGWQGQVLGGFGSALGESRTESLMGAKEFRDSEKQKAAQRMDQRKSELFNSLVNDDRYSFTVGGETYLNQDGNRLWEEGLSDIYKKYDDEMSQIETEATNLANYIFSLNMPLLMADNIFMFGKMAAGGFNTQAKAAMRLRNGVYGGVGSTGRGVARGLATATSEGFEEVNQKIISEGAKKTGEHNMAAFNNGKYDKNAIKDISEWLMSITDNAGGVLEDPKTWEEFAVGFLTGAIGMPKRGGWAGGVVGEVKNSRANREAGDKAAEKLNEIIREPEFRQRWESAVRHKASDNAMEKALAENDKFTWRGEYDKQLINDVMSFAKAGRLNDLEAYARSFADIREDEVHNVRRALFDDTDDNFKNKTDKEIIEWLGERSKDIKDTINQYRAFYNTIDFMSHGAMSDEAIEEMVYTYSQLDNFEKRYSKLAEKVFKKIEPTLRLVASEQSFDRPTERAKEAQQVLASSDSMLKLFGGVAADISNVSQDSVAIDDAKQENVLDTLEKWGAFTKDPSVKKEVADLQKLVRSRQDYYSKLFSPFNREHFQEAFERDAVTDEDAVDDAKKDGRKAFVDDSLSKLRQARTLGDYVRIYGSIEPENDDDESALLAEIDSDDDLSKYEEMLKNGNDFMNSVIASINKKKASDPDNPEVYDKAIGYLMRGPYAVLDDMSDDDGVEEHIAGRILDENDDDDVDSVLRDAFEDVLGDVAISRGLGKRPSAGGQGGGEGGGAGSEGGTGSGEGSGGGTGGGISVYDHIKDLINNISAYDSDALQRYINGDFDDIDQLTQEQINELVSLALQKYDDLKIKAGLSNDPAAVDVEGQDDDADSPQRKARREALAQKEVSSISGSHLQYYHPGSRNDAERSDPRNAGLRDGVKRRMEGKTQGMRNTLNWMHDHGVQEFVDSGALAKLERKHSTTGHLPIYFLANPHIDNNDPDANPFAVKLAKKSKYGDRSVEVMLAVEMTDENRSELDEFYKAGVLSDKWLLDVDGSKYQVIGEVWNPTPDEIKSKKANKALYEDMKAGVQKLWEHTVYNSVLPQYESGNSGFDPEGRWYVAKNHDKDQSNKYGVDVKTGDRISTTINYIMSGRNETKTITDPKYRKIELRSSMEQYRKSGGEFYFAMPTTKGVETSDGGPALHAGIKAPLGSLWMATREANGKFSWNYVTIARTGEFDFEANKSTALVKRFDNAADILFHVSGQMTGQELADDIKARNMAKKELYSMFHLGDGNMITWSYHNGGVAVMFSGRRCLNKEDLIEALREQDCRFQVDFSWIRSNPARLGELLDAGVLRSEMRSFFRMGATFGVNFLEDRDASNNKVSPYAVSTSDVAFDFDDVTGASLLTTMSDNGSTRNIRVGNVGYELSDDGRVFYMGPKGYRGAEVFNNVAIAEVKALAEVIDMYGDISNNVKTISKADMARYEGNVYIVNRQLSTRGKDGKIKKGMQYVEMYERDINGIKVYMERWGRNGNVRLVWDKERWDELMEFAERVKKISDNDNVDDEFKASDDADTYSRIKDEVKPQTPTDKTESDPGGWDDIDLSLMGGTDVQDQKREDDEKTDDFDCPF